MVLIRPPFAVFYDGACQICRQQMIQLSRDDVHGRLVFRDITYPAFNASAYGLDQSALHRSLHVMDANGKIATGIDAFTWLWRAIERPVLASIFRLPLIRWVARLGYKVFARGRYLWSSSRGASVCRGKCAWRGY